MSKKANFFFSFWEDNATFFFKTSKKGEILFSAFNNFYGILWHGKNTYFKLPVFFNPF